MAPDGVPVRAIGARVDVHAAAVGGTAAALGRRMCPSFLSRPAKMVFLPVFLQNLPKTWLTLEGEQNSKKLATKWGYPTKPQ